MARGLFVVVALGVGAGCGVGSADGDGGGREDACVPSAWRCGSVIAAVAGRGSEDAPGFLRGIELHDGGAGTATVTAVDRTELSLAIGNVAAARFRWPPGLPAGIAVGDQVRVAIREPWALVATDSFTLAALVAGGFAVTEPGAFPGGGEARFVTICGLPGAPPACGSDGEAVALEVGGVAIPPGGAAFVGEWQVQVLSGAVYPPTVFDGVAGEGWFLATAVARGPGCASEAAPAGVCGPVR